MGVARPGVKVKNVSRRSLAGKVTPAKLLSWPDMSAGLPCCPHVPHHVELAAGCGGDGQNTEQVPGGALGPPLQPVHLLSTNRVFSVF